MAYTRFPNRPGKLSHAPLELNEAKSEFSDEAFRYSETRTVSNEWNDRAHILAALKLAGAVVIREHRLELHLRWPDATPWLAVVQDVASGMVLDSWIQAEALAEQEGDCHLVALRLSHLIGIDPEDVRRAMDIQRRARLLHARDRFVFSADDAFVQHIKLPVLRALQRALEESPAATLMKLGGRPVIGPGDERLLAEGPSIGYGDDCDTRFREMTHAAQLENAR